MVAHRLPAPPRVDLPPPGLPIFSRSPFSFLASQRPAGLWACPRSTDTRAKGMIPKEVSEMSRRRPRRTFTAEYKAEVVAMYRTTDKTVTEIAKELDLTESAVSRWVKQGEVDAGERSGLTTTEREELAYLRRENRVLREERDILKRATAFFAKETR